jgi:SnoaL-like domain
MPSHDRLEAFIARVEQNAHAEAIEEFYTLGASMRENMAPPRVGRDLLVAHERKVLARAKTVASRCVRPVLADGDIVAVRWVFDFVWLDGTTTRMEEIAHQRWECERIAEETFFYDPAQRVALSAAKPRTG